MSNETKTIDITTLTRPADVSEQLGVDAKQIRAFLRREFTRDATRKNTSWHLTPDMVEAIVDHFTPADDAEASDDAETDE